MHAPAASFETWTIRWAALPAAVIVCNAIQSPAIQTIALNPGVCCFVGAKHASRTAVAQHLISACPSCDAVIVCLLSATSRLLSASHRDVVQISLDWSISPATATRLEPRNRSKPSWTLPHSIRYAAAEKHMPAAAKLWKVLPKCIVAAAKLRFD